MIVGDVVRQIEDAEPYSFTAGLLGVVTQLLSRKGERGICVVFPNTDRPNPWFYWPDELETVWPYKRRLALGVKGKGRKG